GVWLLPAIADKVIAVRDHDRAYGVVSAEEYFQCDLDEFGASGTAVSFYVLSSCALALCANQTLYTFCVNAADNGAVAHGRMLDSSGNTIDTDLVLQKVNPV